MRVGIIDLGTNSVRFDIHQFGPGRKVRALHREKIMVRLGQGAFLSGKLDRKAVQRSLHAFARFKQVAAQLKTSRILAFGTSALRDVEDRQKFLDQIRDSTGIDVRVISGPEEARLIALGVLKNEKLPKGTFALIDIGGGSTEINICRKQTVLHGASFQLGTARLQQVFLGTAPPSPAAIEELRKHVRGTLYPMIAAESWPRVDRVIGSSGTIRALAKLLDDKVIERGKLSRLVSELGSMTIPELLGMSGMEARRVDMIVAGALLFEECMLALGAKKAQTTEYSLRDGLLEEERQLFQQGKSSHLALHFEDLYEKSERFGGNRAHLARVVRLGEDLFSKMRPLHKLSSQWVVYLSAALILRDVGEAINLSRHPEHSRYIVRHIDLPPMEEWEADFIATLCEAHESQSRNQGIPKLKSKSKSRKEAFQRVLTMLRIVDALDPGAETQVRLRSVKITRGTVTLRFTGRRLTGLEHIHAEAQAPLFRKTFKRELVVEQV